MTIALLCTLAQGAWAEKFTVDGLKYITDSNNPSNVSVTGAADETMAGALTIPSTVTYDGKTYNVTTIGYGAFAWCENITSVTISEGVTTIENDAFGNCEKLESVSIPASVTSVGEYLFLHSDALKTITVADDNTVYDSREGCNAIIETSTNTLVRACNTTVIPSSVTAIGQRAFFSLGGLTSITIPNHVTTIDYGAFYGCKNLVSVTIGDRVTDIPWSCFSECKNLETITLGNGVQSIGNSAFNNCSKLETINFAVDSHLTFIDGYAFYNCGLKSVTLPNSVTTLGETIFSWCRQLKEVTFGSAITSIPFYSFTGCQALKSLYIPAGVVSMGGFFEYCCEQMEDVYCSADPATMYWWSNDDDFAPGKSTRFHVFDKAAWEAKFPDANVTFVQDLVGGGSLTYSVNQGVAAVTGTIEENPTGVLMIPATYTDANGTYPVKTIAANAFKDKTGLTAVSFPSVTVIGPSAFEGCTGLTTLTIPATVSSISTDAFKGCTGLRSLVINANVGNGSVFAGCTNVAAVTFGQGVTTIGAQLFQGFTQLTAVTIPSSVTSIGTEAFDGCSALSSVTFEGDTPPATIGTPLFYGTSSDLRIVVPAGSVDAYKTALDHYASRVECKSWTGNGSESTPYLISHKDELDLLAKRVNEGITYDATWFKVTADITYNYAGLGSTDSNYEAIGCHNGSDRCFKGTFDGQNHVISGIRIYKDGYDDEYQALFGLICRPAEVKNVILADATITGYGSTGAIVGFNPGGTVANCHALSTVTVHNVMSWVHNHGGIAGYNGSRGTITGCTSAASITNADGTLLYAGGIAGLNGDGTISDCIYLGTSLGGSRHVGAIVGDNYDDGIIKTSYFTDTAIQGKDGSVNTLDNAHCAVGSNEATVDATVGPALRDDADNSHFLSLMAARTQALTAVSRTPALNTTVTLALHGRTLYKDGKWNTLCLPFDVTISGSPLDGDGVDVRTLTGASFEAGTLTLNFTASGAVTKLEAGKPYLIKWNNTGANLTESELVFSNVTIKNGTNDVACDLGNERSVTFMGTYKKLSYDADDRSILLLGANNTLYYPQSGASLGAQRAYFKLSGITAGDKAAGVRSFVLDFGDGEEATGIGNLTVNSQLSTLNSDTWYTLDGRRLSGKPAQKGIYINNGKKIVIK